MSFSSCIFNCLSMYGIGGDVCPTASHNTFEGKPVPARETNLNCSNVRPINLGCSTNNGKSPILYTVRANRTAYAPTRAKHDDTERKPYYVQCIDYTVLEPTNCAID